MNYLEKMSLICSGIIVMSGIYFENIKGITVLDVVVVIFSFMGHLVFVLLFLKSFIKFGRMRIADKLSSKKSKYVQSKKLLAKIIWGSEEVTREEEKLKNEKEKSIEGKATSKKKFLEFNIDRDEGKDD